MCNHNIQSSLLTRRNMKYGMQIHEYAHKILFLKPAVTEYFDGVMTGDYVQVINIIQSVQTNKFCKERATYPNYSGNTTQRFDVLLTAHLSIFISLFNQLHAQNFCFTISLFLASTCFKHMCSSSGGQNCITQPLVSSHL